MPFLIRSACLTGYVEVARSLGLDPFSLVREAGIDRSCLFDPDIKIQIEPVIRLLEMSASAARVKILASAWPRRAISQTSARSLLLLAMRPRSEKR